MRKQSRIPALSLAAAALLAFAMAGCASRPPGQLTDLKWPGYDTTVGKKRVPVPARKPVRTASRDTSSVAVPTPKPRRNATYIAPVRQVAADPNSRFLWPVSGTVISTFGTMSTGGRNDGINIAVPAGEPVRAAASGTVTYAGELRGYGKLVLVEHDDGYVTAYAHTQSVNVNSGDRVLRGQVIAYSGDSGDVRRPQLHFEIRRGVTPVDPQPLLVAYARS